ncbi:PorP/SprF family type IX secretion system membrane protein [Plebeiibacterium sediminum]|uniref:PorP/SprF family type IX secretion system membrane protein n=1 Tax=Plebeiibacterium sediminum TaxID=2992112 RepID=A0AAE3M3C2_9BACT|nr:PorP/SprF family type IX secretion system membrane protein [Plebeiobacterium sediminum]MCW3786412.1 PorP/SprF family type IX secretion system membrane protein [Plebeiobacterium sediminum]
MRNYILILLIIIVYGQAANGQEHYITNLYVYDCFLMNPAAAGGDKSCNTFNAYYQKQWFGMDDSPSTQLFSYQFGISSQLGSGTYIYNDKNGYTSQLGLQQSFSYEIKLLDNMRQKSSIQFGLSINVAQSRFDQSAFIGQDQPFDPVMSGGTESGWGINSNTGFFLKFNNHHLGMSLTNLLPQNNPLYNNDYDNELPADLNIHMGTWFKLSSRDVFLFPELMYRRNKFADTRFDINLKLKMPTYNQKLAYWTILCYRRSMDHKIGRDLSSSITAGVNYDRMSFGIEYQMSLSGTQNYYGNGVQLVVGYKFNCNNFKKGAVPCSFQDVIYDGIKRKH